MLRFVISLFGEKEVQNANIILVAVSHNSSPFGLKLEHFCSNCGHHKKSKTHAKFVLASDQRYLEKTNGSRAPVTGLVSLCLPRTHWRSLPMVWGWVCVTLTTSTHHLWFETRTNKDEQYSERTEEQNRNRTLWRTLNVSEQISEIVQEQILFFFFFINLIYM